MAAGGRGAGLRARLLWCCSVAWLASGGFALESYVITSTNSYCGAQCSGEYFRSTSTQCNGYPTWDTSDGKFLYKWGAHWILSS